MQRTYFQGLKLKPSFDQIVGYLENDQQFMSHPDRTYTRLKNDQYYSNLNMAGVNSINAQSDNLLKEQARQLDRTKQMQTLGLSQPQVTAANIASGMSTPVVQQVDIASQVGVDSEDRALIAEQLAEFDRLEQEAKQAQIAKVQGEVASASASGLSSFARQREESAERRRLEHGSGAPSAQNQGNSPFQARPRSSSRVRTLSDLSQDFQSASGSQGDTRGRSRDRVGGASGSAGVQTVPLETSYEGEIDFSRDTKETGVPIDNPFGYWSGQIKTGRLGIIEQLKNRGLPYDATKTNAKLIAELINNDRSKKGKSGQAVAQGGKTVIIQQPPPLTQFPDAEKHAKARQPKK